jgi:hypothetical protein
MVETKGYTLEEIAIAFDGSQVNLISPDAYTVEHSPVQGDHMSTASADKAREPNDVKAM